MFDIVFFQRYKTVLAQHNYIKQHHEEINLVLGSHNIGVILAQRSRHLPN